MKLPFRSSSLLSLARGPPWRPISRRTTFATLARRSALPPPTRLLTSPTALLLQLSGITFTSLLIPIIGARRRHSSAGVAETEAAAPAPAPTPKQLQYLSATLRKRLEAPAPHPYDGIFMLRQLNMVTQTPSLSLPPLSPSSDDESTHQPSLSLKPEKWIWRFPSTVSLHSILRILHHPSCSDRTRDALLPLAVRLAAHAQHWDSLMWGAVLLSGSGGEADGVKWDRLMARVRGHVVGQGLEEEVSVRTKLVDRRGGEEEGGNKGLEEWERRAAVEEREVWVAEGTRAQQRWKRIGTTGDLLSDRPALRHSPPDVSPPDVSPAAAPALAPTLHPLSSLPQQTLDLLFLYLAQHAHSHPSSSSTSDLLALTLSRSDLRQPVSLRTSIRAIQFALSPPSSSPSAPARARPDLAARLWHSMLLQVQSSPTGNEGHRQCMRMFEKLKHLLRDSGKRFSTEMRREELAAVAVMARALEGEWERLSAITKEEHEEGRVVFSPLDQLLDLLATFPLAPFVYDFPLGTERRRLASLHGKVDKMIRRVFRGIVEDIVGRRVYLGVLRVVVGEETSVGEKGLALPDMKVSTFNLLITHSLRQFHSSELALRLVESMRSRGLTPTAATNNILIEVVARSGKDVIPHKDQRNERTFPSLVRYLASQGEWQQIDRIIFFLLPELDLPPFADSASLPPATPPPNTSTRTPELYLTLLSALVVAGRTGLAERVFRSARWAAEISRHTPSSPSNSKEERPPPWTLPPRAFILMLRLYASETRLRPSSSSSSPATPAKDLVIGWGRHALRLFLLRQHRLDLQERLGASSSLPTRLRRPEGFSPLPAFLRSEAAAIVATHELEGGSQAEELESLAKAMRSEEARPYLKALFPGRLDDEDREWSREIRRRGRKRAVEERRMIMAEGGRARERRRMLEEAYVN